MNNDSLTVSEHFYSIQGEGITVGTPSVFLRLTGCNLTCRAWSATNKAGEVIGCDTYEVWRKGTTLTFREILTYWRQQGWISALDDGAHLVVTGGEPMLYQGPLLKFILELEKEIGFVPFVEVETNGTIIPTPEISSYVAQFNVSPKLASAGDPKSKRYNADALQTYADDETSVFKFVLTKPDEWDEVLTAYLTPFDIPRSSVVLMPEGATHERLKENSKWLIDLCKKQRVRYSPRMHIHVYDQTTGV